MLKTVEVFDAIKARHSLRSDYALARFLQISPGLISKHRSRPFGMGDDLALRCANALRYDPALLLVWAACERADCTPQAEAWARLACWLELRKNELMQEVAAPWSGGERRAESAP